MAEIQVERKRSRAGAGWAVGLLLLVALLGAGWYFTMGPGAGTTIGDDPDIQSPAGGQYSPTGPSAPPTGAGPAPGEP